MININMYVGVPAACCQNYVLQCLGIGFTILA